MTNDGKAIGSLVLTVIVAVLMILSVALVAVAAVPSGAASPAGSAVASPALASISALQAPPPPASGTFALNPTVFTLGTGLKSTISTVGGGTFGSGGSLTFCVSTTTSFSASASVGTYVLAGGATSIPSGTVVTLSGGNSIVSAAGSYYIAVTDGSGCGGASTYTAGVAITVTSVAPTLTSPGTVEVGSSAGVAPSGGWDPSSTVTLYLSQPGGSTVLSTFTTTSGGSLPSAAAFTVPALAQGTYSIVAKETAGPATAASVGITADSTFTVNAAVTVTPFYYDGASGSTLTVSGTGFTASSTIAANTITVGSHATTQAAVTVTSSGTFTVPVTTVTAIAPPGGPEGVGVSTSPGSTPSSFAGAVFVSSPNPGELKTQMSPTTVTPTAAIAAEAWNFPIGATVTFTLGSTVLGTVTASSLGFAQLPATAALPGMPAGSYTEVAGDHSAGLYTSFATPIVVSALFYALDPSGATVSTSSTPGSSEYVPSDGTLTIFEYGLAPGAAVTITDSVWTGAVTGNSIGLAYSDGLAAVSVSTGSLDAVAGNFFPAGNGTLVVAYSPLYDLLATIPTTGAAEQIATPVTIAYYDAVGTVTLSPSDWTTYAAGATGTSITVSGLIPVASATTLYPGTPAVSDYYNIYVGSSVLTGTSGSSTCLTTAPTECYGTTVPSATLTLHFTVPSATGVQDLSAVYNGRPASSALATVPIVVSTPGASAASGTIQVVTDPITSQMEVIGFNLLPVASASSYALNISTSAGVTKVVPTVTSSGAMTAYDLNSLTDEPAGTYSVILFVVSTSGASASLSTKYSVGVALAISTPQPATGPIGTAITAKASGLLSNGFYDVYFAGAYVKTAQATSAGDIASITGITVPLLVPGTYDLTIDPAGTNTAVASAAFAVTNPTSFTLLSAQGDPSTAFPNEIISFAWTPPGADLPSAPSLVGATSPFYGPVEVTVYLNGTAFTTFAATYTAGPPVTLSGSFQMPNALAGSFWSVTLGWSQAVYTTMTTLLNQPFADSITTGSAGNSATGSGAALTPPDSQAYLADFYATGASLSGSTLVAEVNFNGNVFSLTYAPGAAITVGLHPATVAVVSGTGTVTATFDVTAETSGTVASTSTSLTFTVSGFYNGEPFNSNVALTLTDAASSGTNGVTTQSWSASDALFGTWIGTLTTSTSALASYTSASATYLQLVSGNGALLTGITPAQIAEITTAVNQTLTVPIAELNAAVTSINGAVVKITTAFGNMTTTLNAIDATVSANAAGIANIQNGLLAISSTLGDMTASLSTIDATVVSISNNMLVLNSMLGTMNTTLTALNANVTSIAGGVATLKTDVGQIQVNLTAIGAQLTAFQTSTTGTLATITSTLGTMSATLNSIGTTVTSINNGVATIQTDLGTLTGNVSSISNGVVTIQTKLGTLQTSVNAISTNGATASSLNTLEILMIVGIVLIAVTLAIALVALAQSRRMRPPSGGMRVYEQQ
jgi:hypothetical protein